MLVHLGAAPGPGSGRHCPRAHRARIPQKEPAQLSWDLTWEYAVAWYAPLQGKTENLSSRDLFLYFTQRLVHGLQDLIHLIVLDNEWW
jgi:hypothetical protein